MNKLKLLSIFIILILTFNSLIVTGIKENNKIIKLNTKIEKISNDFYFVQISDTHIINPFLDRNEISKKRLKTVLNYICSFKNKPVFIVITGDLTEWGGIINCKTFTSCFYNKDGQFYADINNSIPIYSIPGNHDYLFKRNLKNYYKYITNKEMYTIYFNDTSLFFIDSGPNYYAEPNDWFDINGDGLSNSSIEWLTNSLINCSSRHKIILMHHPAINKRNKQGEMIDVIANNRKNFINICESYKVDLVLSGHTHEANVYDSNEKIYDQFPINCSLFNTLFVQSDDCKQGIHFRNITITGNDILLGKSEDIINI